MHVRARVRVVHCVYVHAYDKQTPLPDVTHEISKAVKFVSTYHVQQPDRCVIYTPPAAIHCAFVPDYSPELT